MIFAMRAHSLSYGLVLFHKGRGTTCKVIQKSTSNKIKKNSLLIKNGTIIIARRRNTCSLENKCSLG